MPSLADHHSTSLVKLLLLGDAKSGKTTALASLVAAGYKLRILDMDNLLDTLAKRVARDCPENLANVEYVSFRDKYAPSPNGGMAVVGKPTAWMDSLRLLNAWKNTDRVTGEVTDLGQPATWGEDTILVIDSLTRWSDAAVEYHEALGGKDGRMNYYNAQCDIEKQLAGLTSAGFATNVIIICHGVLQDRPDGTKKMFPKSAGSALNPLIPSYFPNFIQLTKNGEKRVLRLTSSPMIDLATTDVAALPKELDVDTGLAEFFAVLRGAAAKSTDATASAQRPKAVTLKRI
jgi:hypothetical protein